MGRLLGPFFFPSFFLFRFSFFFFFVLHFFFPSFVQVSFVQVFFWFYLFLFYIYFILFIHNGATNERVRKKKGARRHNRHTPTDMTMHTRITCKHNRQQPYSYVKQKHHSINDNTHDPTLAMYSSMPCLNSNIGNINEDVVSLEYVCTPSLSWASWWLYSCFWSSDLVPSCGSRINFPAFHCNASHSFMPKLL